jgi:hypothetical protein
MNTMGRANRYFGSAREAAQSCDLPLLGILPADPRLHSRAAGLAALAPDPRLSARIYRFVSGAAPVIWVHGLGQAGEELAVAVGIAERAAAGGAAPVLLVRPQESSVEELHGRPVTPGPFARVLGALLPGGAVALPCGIQGVLQAHGRGKHEGDPLTPGGIVLAGEAPGEPPALAPEMITSVVLVVPFRDCPADDIERRVAALRAAGYAPAGVVGYGKEGEGDGLPEAGEMAAAAQIPRGAKPEAQPRERVAVTASWSSRFGPGSSRGSGWGGGMGLRRRAGLPLFWWLVIAIVLLVSAGVIFPKLVLSPRRAGPPAGGELQAGAERQRGTPAARAGAESGETAKEAAPAGEQVSAGDQATAERGETGSEPERGPSTVPPAVPSPSVGGVREGGVPAAEVAWDESPISPGPLRATGDTAAVSLLGGGEASASRGEALTRAGAASAGHPQAGAGIHGSPPAPGESGAAGAGGEPGGPAELALAGDRTAELPAPDAGDSSGAAPALSRSSGAGQQDSAEEAGPDPGGSPAAGGAGQTAAPAAAEPAGDAVRPLASHRGGPFTVLCGSFPEIEMAQTEARRLQRRGLAMRIAQVNIPGRGVWCRVVTGGYADIGAAVDEARAIVAGGHVRTAMVVAAEGYGLPVSRPIEGTAP